MYLKKLLKIQYPLYVTCIKYITFSTVTDNYDCTFQLRYLNGVLVIGTCDSALEFWVPKERYVNL